MTRIKLKEYCDRNSISYNTGYRWFKEGKLPVKAFQLETGTILVEDESYSAERAEQQMPSNTQEVISSLMKKTIELSANNSTIADFAAYILSNFSLTPMAPKILKVKPEPEDIQTYYSDIINKSKQTVTAQGIPILTTVNSEVASELEMGMLIDKNLPEKDVNITSDSTDKSLDPEFVKELIESADPQLIEDVTKSVQLINDIYNKNKKPDSYIKLAKDLKKSFDVDSKSAKHIAEFYDKYRRQQSRPFNRLRTAGATGSFKPTEKEVETASKISSDGYECSDGYFTWLI